MRRFLACAMVGLVLSLGCARTETQQGREAEAYGLFNPDDRRDDVTYSTNWTGVVLAVVFCETLFVPVIVAGWFLFEPEENK